MGNAKIPVVVRRAQSNEAQELSALAMRSKSYWPYPRDYLEKCVDALRIDSTYIERWPVFVAEVARQAVGFFALKTISEEPRLDHLWILPEFIGKSIGSRLFTRSVEEARKLGWTEFWLAADPYAIGFYEKLGAVQLGTVQSRIKPDLFLPHMKVDLMLIPDFRILTADDDVVEINALLRAAYLPLAGAGMRYAASHEGVEDTRRNVENGECHVALINNKIIGCVILKIPDKGEKTGWRTSSPPWYENPGVTHFGRFAMHPLLQKRGYGSLLMDYIEARAKTLGFSELALDTSEHAAHLIKMYEKRGYRFIETHQWPITNYRSVVMSKTL